VKAGRVRVVVLFNPPVLSADHPDAASESDVVEVAREMARGLDELGYESHLLGAEPPLSEWLNRLDRIAPDVIFNLIEGYGGSTAAATHLTGLLELTGYPYTGSPVEALAACVSKSRARFLLKGAGLPVAAGFVVENGESPTKWEWDGPAMIKPDAEDGSLGIDQASVVVDLEAAIKRVTWLQQRYGGATLLEAYLPGSEYNIGVVALPEPVPLPVAEVVYQPRTGYWPILTYDAKWNSGSGDDQASPILCPAPLDHELARRMRTLAVAAFKVTGCRDYARVDLRLDHRGEPIILEVNPNPDIGSNAGWARALRTSGRDYFETLGRLLEQAMRRKGG